MNEHNVKNHYRQELRVTKATINNLPEWRIYLNQELAARCASESFANEICSSLMGSFKHKMLSLVDSLIFPFSTEEEHNKARFSGYIPLCDVVRIKIKDIVAERTIDYPVHSREQYSKELRKLTLLPQIQVLDIYQDKLYYDILEQD
jgi:hypothetical protein